jgi:hypothetical protein
MNPAAVAAVTVCITRYNNKTWAERIAWLAANPEYACIYKSPVPIKSDIPYEAPLFVLEMNNDTNQIMGVGRIVNEVRADRSYRVYRITTGTRIWAASAWTAPTSCSKKNTSR